jgi:hypothetical protein
MLPVSAHSSSKLSFQCIVNLTGTVSFEPSSPRPHSGKTMTPSTNRRNKVSSRAHPLSTVRHRFRGATHRLKFLPFGPELAHTFSELESQKQALESNSSKNQILFNEMLQMCLWYRMILSSWQNFDDVLPISQGQCDGSFDF